MKVVAISGYFDPIHVGHLEYINMAKKLGDKLVVIVNNNYQCELKKGKPFMDEKDRVTIVSNLKMSMKFFFLLIKIKPYVHLWKKLSQIFLQMVVIEKTMKFLNQLFVKNMI